MDKVQQEEEERLRVRMEQRVVNWSVVFLFVYFD